jgi:hypothetical protein
MTSRETPRPDAARADGPRRPPPSDSERRGEGTRSARLVAVFLLGCIGFAGPLLRIASRDPVPGRWPAPFVFLYGFWLLLIVLIFLALRARREE